jgi:hypothetical protein
VDPLFFCGVPVCCAMAAGLVLEARQRVQEIERDRQGWGDYATRRGLHYSCEVKGRWLDAHHRMDGRIRGVPLSCATGLGILRMPTTTITAVAEAPIDGRLYVSCAAVFSQARDDVDVRRLDVGDPDFNGREFVVEATTPELANRVLVPRVRDLLLRLGAFGRQSLNFRCVHDEVIVEWLGHEALPTLFDLGCDVVVGACETRGRNGVYR